MSQKFNIATTLSGSCLLMGSFLALGSVSNLKPMGKSKAELELKKIEVLTSLERDTVSKSMEYKSKIMALPMLDPEYSITNMGKFSYGLVQQSADAISSLKYTDHAIFGLAGFYDKSVELYHKRLQYFKNIEDQ